MILQIVLLCLLIIVVSFVLFFLIYFFVPAVKKQTDVTENVIFSKMETASFSIFNNEAVYEPVVQKAFVLCSCNKKFKYNRDVSKLGGGTCSIVKASSSSPNDCKFSCIGLGDCANVCPQQAIMIQNKTAVISELCNGCGKCVEVCPKQLIKLIPIGSETAESCKNQDENLTTCSDFRKDLKVEYSNRNAFKFWNYWYKIFNGKRR